MDEDEKVEPQQAYSSSSIGAIAKALAAAQAEMGKAKKDSINPHFRSNYTDITSVIDACRSALTSNGIAVVQRAMPVLEKHGVLLQTVLIHQSGEWIRDGGLFIPASKADAQGVGSALTYARRYGLASLVGIAQEDDDGNKAVASIKNQAAASQVKPQARPKTTPTR